MSIYDLHRISNSEFTYLGRGDYATVFVDKARGRVRKVFRVRRGKNCHTKNVFLAECEAYKIANGIPKIKSITPKLFCFPKGLQITDYEGNDVTAFYHPDMVLEIEFIAGSFKKVGEFRSVLTSEIESIFKSAGICHLSDMSFVLRNDGSPVFIDFATKEIELNGEIF